MADQVAGGADDTIGDEQAPVTGLVADVLAAFAAGGHLRTVLQRGAEAAVARLGAAFARIWLVERRDRVLVLQASAGLYTHLDGAHGRIPIGSYKIGRIASDRVPRLTNQVQDDPDIADPAWAAREGMVAFAGYPLVAGDELTGVLAMFFRQPQEAAVLDALALVADSLAVGIQRIRADERARATVENLDRIGQALMAELDHQRALQAVIDAAVQQTAAQIGAFFYEGPGEDGTPHVLCTMAGDPALRAECPVPPAQPAVDALPAAGTVRIADVTAGADPAAMPLLLGAGDQPILRSYLAVPVTGAGGPVRGVLVLGHREPGAFDDSDVRMAEAISGYAAVAIANARLFGAATAAAERERRHGAAMRALADLALGLNTPRSVAQIVCEVNERSREIIGAHQSVTSMTIGQNWAQAISAVSLSDKYAAWRDYDEPPGGSGIYAVVCARNEPMRLTQVELEAHPAWRGFGDAAASHPPMRGWLAAPLVSGDGQNLGLIQLSDRYEGEFDETDEAILVQLAQLAATALGRERARAHERRTADQFRELARAAVAMNRPLTLDETLSSICEHARSIVGARLGAIRVSCPGADDAVAVSLSDEHASWRDDRTASAMAEVSRWLCDGTAAVRLTDDALRGHGAWERLAAGAERRPPLRGCLVAPLRTRNGSHLGELLLSEKHDGEFTEADEDIVVQLAQLASSTLEKERLLEGQVRLVATLQRSLLPERLPDVPNVDLAARYVAGAVEVDVGGDWYDAVTLPDGDLFLVIGDVVGKGVEAAAAMGQLRNALRAYALEGYQPAQALVRLNRLVTTLGGTEFATVLAARLTPATGRLRFASAGHLPPLVVRPDGTAEFLTGAQSVPIGALRELPCDEDERRLVPGSTLVLYTDGLVESRSVRIDDGLARLASAAGGPLREPAALVDHLVAVTREAGEPDDAAVLAVRTSSGGSGLRLRLPASFASLPELRRALRDYFDEGGIDEATCDDVILACSEAAANAVEHPVGPRQECIEVEASCEGGEVIVIVRDFGRWRPPPSAGDRGRGLLLMEALMQVDVQFPASGTEVVLRRRSPALAPS